MPWLASSGPPTSSLGTAGISLKILAALGAGDLGCAAVSLAAAWSPTVQVDAVIVPQVAEAATTAAITRPVFRVLGCIPALLRSSIPAGELRAGAGLLPASAGGAWEPEAHRRATGTRRTVPARVWRDACHNYARCQPNRCERGRTTAKFRPLDGHARGCLVGEP